MPELTSPPTPPTGWALETLGLTRRFGAHTVVDRLSLNVAKGEVFGLLGRNGAGKSTLIKMLSTLLPPSAGRATVLGFDIVRQAAQVREVIGYVPQALSADGELTGYENLLVFARLYDLSPAIRRERIEQSLAFMGLKDAAQKLVGTYSGGMIRRLEIAQSMLHRPQLLFLDEPTVGLDPVARETVWQHLRQLRADFGTTIVMTTHYMEEAQAFCSRMGILRTGTLVACGTLAELRAGCGALTAADPARPGGLLAFGPHPSFSATSGAPISLDALFAFYTGESGEADSAYGDTVRSRQAATRLG